MDRVDSGKTADRSLRPMDDGRKGFAPRLALASAKQPTASAKWPSGASTPWAATGGLLTTNNVDPSLHAETTKTVRRPTLCED